MKVSKRPVTAMLRHLDDPYALRSNPLTSALFRAGDSPAIVHERLVFLRAAIRDALAAIVKGDGNAASRASRVRAATIVERCDLQGAKHDDVAAELGLSRRQFYRDRALAFDLLALELEQRLGPPRTPMAARIDGASLAFENADALVAIARFEEAGAVLARVAAATSDAGVRLKAFAQRLEVACERASAPAVERASADLLCALEAAPPVPASTSARVWVARSIHAAFVNDATAAQRYRDRAFGVLVDASPDDYAVPREKIYALVIDGSAARASGDHQRAVNEMKRAETMLKSSTHITPLLRALVYNELGAALMMSGRLIEASQQNRCAADFAREHRLMRIACASIMNEAVVDYWQGNAKQVADVANSTLELSREVVSHDEFLRMSLIVASISISANQPERALALLSEVRSHAREAPQIAARATLTESQVRLGMEQFPKAVALARSAATMLGAAGANPLVGTALLFAAQGQAAIGERDAALGTVADAITELEHSGSPYALVRAHRLAARLTGAATHRRRARQLASDLGAR